MKTYKDMTETERKQYWDSHNLFILAAHNACTEKDIVVEFECPVCHGKARAVRSGYNGHHRAACMSCDMSFIE